MRQLRKWEYIPVLDFSSSTQRSIRKKEENYFGKEINWCCENSLYKHDSILLNFHNTKNISKKDFGKDVLTFGDSGGFQGLTTGVKLNPSDVITWQEENTDIGFCLDAIPLKKENDEMVFSQNFFEKCLKETKINIETANKIRTKNSSEFMFYNIIQGNNYNNQKKWWDGIKGYNCDGIGFPTSTSNIFDITLMCAFAIENVDKDYVHFLGTGSLMKTAIPMYLSNKKIFKSITFDSSSSNIGGISRTYKIFNNSIQFKSKNDYKKRTSFCHCPVCRTITEHNDEEVFYREGQENLCAVLIILHNLAMADSKNNLLDMLLENNDMENLGVLFNTEACKKINTCTNFIDEVIEKGFEDSYKKYEHIFAKNTKKININNNFQKTIWSGF